MADRSVPDLLTLPHHVEFLSDRWLEEAGRHLREAIPALLTCSPCPITSSSCPTAGSRRPGATFARRSRW